MSVSGGVRIPIGIGLDGNQPGTDNSGCGEESFQN